MERMSAQCLLGLCVVFLDFIVLCKGLEVRVTPGKVQYAGPHSFNVTCTADSADLHRIVTFGFIQILKQNLLNQQRPIVALSNTGSVIWGSGRGVDELHKRSTVTYQLPGDGHEAFLRIQVHSTECSDEGIYTCEMFGLNNKTQYAEAFAPEEFVVYDYSGAPHIANPAIHNQEIFALEGETITLTCYGNAGKPVSPIHWEKYNVVTGQFIPVYNLNGLRVEHGSKYVSADDPCHYNISSLLHVNASLLDPSVTVKCIIGMQYDLTSIFVMERPGQMRRKRSFKRSKDDYSMQVLPSKMVYDDAKNVTITCNMKKADGDQPKLIFMELSRKTAADLKRPVVTVTGNGKILWGHGRNLDTMETRTNVEIGTSGPWSLSLNFKKLDCMDEAQYTCSFMESDKDGNLQEYVVSDELFVNTYAQAPVIKHGGRTLHNQDTIYLTNKGTLNLKCEGYMGRPRAPMSWLRYAPEKGQFLLADDKSYSVHHEIPEDNFCQFKGYSSYQLKMMENEETIQCRVGPLTTTINVIVKDKGSNNIKNKNGDSDSSERRSEETMELLVKQRQGGKGSTVTSNMLVIVTLMAISFVTSRFG